MLKEILPVRGGDAAPVDAFYALREKMDRVFEDWFHAEPGFGLRGAVAFTPRVDLTQADDSLRVTAELPGLDRADVHVELLPGRLVISGKKESDIETKKEKFVRRERFFGEFRREIPLPNAVDEARVNAVFEKGLLTVTLPLTGEKTLTGRKIAIR